MAGSLNPDAIYKFLIVFSSERVNGPGASGGGGGLFVSLSMELNGYEKERNFVWRRPDCCCEMTTTN